jgi:hypothetical protein
MVEGPPLLSVVEAHNIERLWSFDDAEEWSKDHHSSASLRHLGEPLEPPKRAPARDPPYFKTQVLRRKFAELN